MLHCPQTCDVGAQETRGGGPLCAFKAQVSISVIPSQIFFYPCIWVNTGSIQRRKTYESPGCSLPGLF